MKIRESEGQSHRRCPDALPTDKLPCTLSHGKNITRRFGTTRLAGDNLSPIVTHHTESTNMTSTEQFIGLMLLLTILVGLVFAFVD